MPQTGEIWRTRFNYRCRIIATDAIGSHPIVGLILVGSTEIPATFNALGQYRDPAASDFDLVSLMPKEWRGEGWRADLEAVA